MAITIKDENNIPRYLKNIAIVNDLVVEIGIFGSQGSDIMMIAHVNEFGVNIRVTDKMRGYLGANGVHLKKTTTEIKIPERSFIRGTFDAHQAKIADFAEAQFSQVQLGIIKPNEMFLAIGEYCAARVRLFMTRLDSPENHPYTIEKKGSSNPLIDTGNLRRKVTYKVRKVR